jgi:hypothetical protein
LGPKNLQLIADKICIIRLPLAEPLTKSDLMTSPLLSLGFRGSKPKKLLNQMRVAIRTAFIIATVFGPLLIAAPSRAQVNIDQIVRQKIQPILPKNGEGGRVAVAVQMNGKTSFFNYGFADNAENFRLPVIRPGLARLHLKALTGPASTREF